MKVRPEAVEVAPSSEVDADADETDFWSAHPNPPDPDQRLNRAIAEHQRSLDDWKILGNFDLARELTEVMKWYRWLRADALIPEVWKKVPLDLPEHIRVTFEIRPARELGFYKYGRAISDGTRWNINLNPRSIIVFGRSPAQTASVLCHEALHLCEDDYSQKIGKKTRSAGYHSTEFRRQAELIGIPCNAYGVEGGIRPGSPFDRWLEKHGIPQIFQYAPEPMPPAPLAKRIAWRCGCEEAVSVMVPRASQLNAVCRNCSQFFRPVNPDKVQR